MLTNINIIAALAAIALLGVILLGALGANVPDSLQQALATLTAGIVGGGIGAAAATAGNDKRDAKLRAEWDAWKMPDA
jgi:hypothetical protein